MPILALILGRSSPHRADALERLGAITVEQRGDGDILVGGCWGIGVETTSNGGKSIRWINFELIGS